MLRDEALCILSQHREDLVAAGVQAIFLFGSVARNEARADSDVDLLVELDPSRHLGVFAFLRLKEQLEEFLGCPVDLVTLDALKDPIRERILSEAVRAA